MENIVIPKEYREAPRRVSANSVSRRRLYLGLSLAAGALLFGSGASAQAPASPQSTAASQGRAGAGPRAAAVRVRPRIIATTDGEIDDRCSMIRFLMYANEWDVEGIIYSSSMHWLGQTWSGVEWISADVDHYARVYSHLRENADGYPTPEELKSKIYVGNITARGEMQTDSPGSDHIVRVLLDDKPGPVYLQAWGGTNTIARALWKIQHEYPEQVEKVNQKAILYIILDQDPTLKEYVRPNWPKLQVLGSFRQFAAIAYGWAGLIPMPQRAFFERPWLEGHITVDRGPLAGAYEPNNGAFRSEGDSPSFMHQIDVGLRSLENPSYGGWGGRFVPETPKSGVWTDAEDDGDLYKPIWRWAEAFQNDWAARADWCVKSFRDANHPPIVNLAVPKDIEAAPGATVKLSVAGSADVDGDRLYYSWWRYREPSTYKGEVAITDADRAAASVQIPMDAKPGDTIHLIGEVTDSGKPPLTRYARVIVTVKPR
jgi:hypothetical protein